MNKGGRQVANLPNHDAEMMARYFAGSGWGLGDSHCGLAWMQARRLPRARAICTRLYKTASSSSSSGGGLL